MNFKKELLTTKQAAEYLGLSPGTLHNWRCTKVQLIPYIKAGSRVFYRISDLERWLESNLVNSKSEEINNG